MFVFYFCGFVGKETNREYTTHKPTKLFEDRKDAPVNINIKSEKRKEWRERERERERESEEILKINIQRRTWHSNNKTTKRMNELEGWCY